MKDSGIEWIGEIPEEWEVSKFKNSSQLYVGDSIKDSEKDNYLDKHDAKAYVATKDLIVDENMIDFSNTLYVKNDNLKFKIAPKRSSLICIEGGSAGRKKAFLDRDVCFVNKLCCINPLNFMDKKYMFYLISNQAFEQEFDKYIQGLIGGVSINKLSNFNIPLPTLKEQHKISSFLDNEVNKINISIGYIYEQVENLENYKKSLITEAVTKGLDKNVPMKDSGIEWIGQIPKHWKVIRIKNLGTCRNGLTYSPSDTCDDKDGILVLRSSNVQNGKIVLNNNVYVNIRIPEDLMVKDGDILICSRNGSRELIGKNAIINNLNATFGAFMMIYRSKNPKLMYYVLNSNIFQYYLGSFFTSTINQLTNSNFENMKIVWCEDTNEQEKIAKYLDNKTKLIDETISIKQKQLQTLEEYKKSLIYEYVTGKKEV